MNDILLAFIPIFVAVDAIGTLPIFVSFTQGLTPKERFKILVQSIVTAICLAVGFIFLGKFVFQVLSITIGDFMVAGGVLLFCLAIIDLAHPNKVNRLPSQELGIVPLGTPLIVGPAVLTTTLILIDQHGLAITLIAVVANILLAGFLFLSSDILMRFLGDGGARALSKVTSLLLAAIAVMMVRKGIMHILTIP